MTRSLGIGGPMSPRTLELLLAAALLLVGLVPLAWPGTGPAIINLLVSILGVVGPVAAVYA